MKAIEVINVTKDYKLYDSQKHALKELLTGNKNHKIKSMSRLFSTKI
mgnify:CR=1 FL=1